MCESGPYQQRQKRVIGKAGGKREDRKVTRLGVCVGGLSKVSVWWLR